MYEAVHSGADGECADRLVGTAADYGFEGVVLWLDPDAESGIDPEALAAEHGIDVVAGVEIRAGSPGEADGRVNALREERTVLAVRGGTDTMNRFAVERPEVDVLARPMAGDGDVNHVLAKAAVENGVRLEFSLSPVLRQSGGRRVRALQSLRKLREVVGYYDAPVVVSADPESRFELRAPRELAAVGEAIGFDRETIEDGLAEWGRLAERNRRIDSEAFIEPGVQAGRYDEDR
ncbi:RNase P subunit p30 family protein [Saliphagus infecundisoli]|uniref:Ribonuclease P protein component 3 n=1 Tax=Saliphagus infecundisoli TaxID=1849069 RepID=A0ABD5QG14_9EURY|nr:RNase P subunit p30 family protein [Saliphagus infecundisoli]